MEKANGERIQSVKHTDQGYSEKQTDIRMDLGSKAKFVPKQIVQQIVPKQKKTITIFKKTA